MSQIQIISSNQISQWYDALSLFKDREPSFLPEYHRAYLTKSPNSKALLWLMQVEDFAFCYPFILTPVAENSDILLQKYPQYYDISSVYGYGGPLANNPSEYFLAKAWSNFDEWAQSEQVIAEFIRFSPYSGNHLLAHPRTSVELNRKLAVSNLPSSPETFWQLLDSKTKNMVKKAQKQGLYVEEMPLNNTNIELFQALYTTTMQRNVATDFFYHDARYYDELMALGPKALRLFGVYHQAKVVAAAMILIHHNCALYHLSAADPQYSRLGAGNLMLWHISNFLIKQDLSFFNLGGGRTTNPHDSLWKYKRSNSIGEALFYIGKRIINAAIYQEILAAWQAAKGHALFPSTLLFYRS